MRAINLIWALSLCKTSRALTTQLAKKIVAGLADHMFYLEHHWELVRSILVMEIQTQT